MRWPLNMRDKSKCACALSGWRAVDANSAPTAGGAVTRGFQSSQLQSELEAGRRKRNLRRRETRCHTPADQTRARYERDSSAAGEGMDHRPFAQPGGWGEGGGGGLGCNAQGAELGLLKHAPILCSRKVACERGQELRYQQRQKQRQNQEQKDKTVRWKALKRDWPSQRGHAPAWRRASAGPARPASSCRTHAALRQLTEHSAAR